MQKDQEENKNQKSENALREEAILAFWKENKIFQKSLDKEAPKGNYVFYDGPPFATGQIHYGHILGSTAKDVIGRYKTMQGYNVPRKWGWDCHGLPIEHLVEKELGIAGHGEIEKLGIDKFVEYARSKVLQFDKEWEKGIERIGRWVDFEGGYKTMDNTFIESVWWALGELNKKELVYEGVRVLAYCARCETPIANSEIAMDNSYKDITDISVYVKFQVSPDQENLAALPPLRGLRHGQDFPDPASHVPTYLLAWTTTPWTLPGNTAIAINKDIDYVKVKIGEENFILAKANAEKVLKEKEYVVLEEFKGEKLIGKRYKPVFPYYENTEMPHKENIYKVWHADFVTTEKGTGIAHEAPAFGEDDMDLAKEHNIPWIIHVDEEGKFKSEVVDFAGQKVKPAGGVGEKDVNQKADIEVIKYLAKNDLLFAKEKIVHSYPHCMRCDTPIIYYALPSWFINITKVKDSIVKNASSMNWIPSHLKEGRFGHSLAGAPDWNISRNRYWASPLPIWKCASCDKITFVNSVKDLQDKSVKSGNKYFVMRHGETDKNVAGLVCTVKNSGSHLTKKGEEDTKINAEGLKDKNVDLVFVSPFNRTKETAKIVADVLSLKEDQIVFDDRLVEMNVKSYEGRTWEEYHKDFPKEVKYFDKAKEGDESYLDVKKRVADFIFEIEEKYKNKNILIITHGGPAWLLTAVSKMLENKDTLALVNRENNFHYFQNSEIQSLDFVPFPHNSFGDLDLHRPYIDDIKLKCDCGENIERIPEVLDCWFESGSMPFAQDHYPFANQGWQKNNFPAGFVAEYIAQTRTWFYYTHAISSMLFGSAPFNNVVTTGTLRAEDGQKMSKSKKNYPDPWVLVDKYGVDPLRIYLMASPLMKGEDANFSEKIVQEIASKIIGRLFNVLSFYELYRDVNLELEYGQKKENSPNVLDQWILSRFDQTLDAVTLGMDAYDMAEAVRPIEGFVDDLSTWYLRRSRDRIKDGAYISKITLYYILKNLSIVLSPFAPFSAEDIWQRLKNENDKESVHLVDWPTYLGFDFEVLDAMQNTRDIVSLGLEARQRANIKVRQPLSELKVKSLKLSSEYIELIKDELNVKEVVEDASLEVEIFLDLNINDELKQEGDYRELVRGLQDMRKDAGLVPSDIISLFINTDEKGEEIVNKFLVDMQKTVGAREVKFEDNDGIEIKVGEQIFKIKIEK